MAPLRLPYPTRPTKTILFDATTNERHGYFGPSGLSPEFDHVYRYVIDSDGWLFHRLVIDEFGRTLGKAFRWQRSGHGDPSTLAGSLIAKWQVRQTKFTIQQSITSPPLL